MKILHVVNTYSSGNGFYAQPFVKGQIESLRRQGIDVDIFDVNGSASSLNYLHAIPNIRKYLRKINYDLVHGHYVYSGIIAGLQSMSPSIVSFMGSDLHGSYKEDGRLELRGILDIFLSKIAQYMADGIIVKSKYMYDWLVRKDKAIILPNGVDFELFQEIKREKARALLGLNLTEDYVLFPASTSEQQKGYKILEKAVEILNRKGIPIKILLSYPVAHEKMPIYMNAANVVALPSHREGSPNVIKEAMACNIPIISTDVGDVREIIGGVEGCRIVPRNHCAFADAIEESINSVERTKGRKAIEHLRTEEVSRRLIQFYKDVLRKNGKVTS